MGKELEVTRSEAVQWLEGYKAAWEDRDVEKALSLFTEDVDYREVRFGPPLLKHANLETYWRVQVREFQRDPNFQFELWGVSGNQAIATWQAHFHWLPINSFIKIDGVFRLVFSARGPNGLLCSQFNEWFDFIEQDSLNSADIIRRNRPRGAE